MAEIMYQQEYIPKNHNFKQAGFINTRSIILELTTEVLYLNYNKKIILYSMHIIVQDV